MRFHLLSRLFVVITALLLSDVSFGQNSKDQAAQAESQTILFVCEHGAAKSVIAAAHFNKLAKERGLKYRAVFRGTNPDPTLATAAEKGLKEDGIETLGWKPTIVTKKDMDAASRVIAMGCALPDKDAFVGKIEEWNDISSVSQNYHLARDEIVKKVQNLIVDMEKTERETKGKKKTTP
jgi:protein-tyrosine-phosphatase